VEPRFWQDDPDGEPGLARLFDASTDLPDGVDLIVDRGPADLRFSGRLVGGAALLVGGGALGLGIGIPDVLRDPDPLGRVIYPLIVFGLAGWCASLLRGARRRLREATNVERGRRRYGAFLLDDALVLRLSNRWTTYSYVARIPWSLVEPPRIRVRWAASLGGTIPELFLRYRPTPGAPVREVALGYFEGARRFVTAVSARITEVGPRS
jgi:hypothetical protein